MIVTGYALKEAIAREEVSFRFALSIKDYEAAEAAVQRMAALGNALGTYVLVCRTNVHENGKSRQLSLSEASDREEGYKQILADMAREISTPQPPVRDPLQYISIETRAKLYRELSITYARLRSAVAEGYANKLDTDEHQIAVDASLLT